MPAWSGTARRREYPLVLTTGCSLYHYHIGSMTRKAPGLRLLRNRELVEMNPAGAGKLGIADGEMVRVEKVKQPVAAR